jgi:glycosyltransferase involved in cell wall biosynthesis
MTIYNDWPPQLHPPLSGAWTWHLAWEFTSIPKLWRDVILLSDVRMWVPSTFVMDTLLKAGIPAERITLVPHAVMCSIEDNLDAPESSIEDDGSLAAVDEALALCKPGDFVYLFHGASMWRKGLDVLLRVFLEAPEGVLEGTCLVVHSMYGTDDVKALVRDAAARFDKQATRRLVLLTRVLSQPGVARLIGSSDAVVHPSRGEGFGLVAAEALACGKPLIATREGGTSDFATEDTAFLVDGEFVPCDRPPCDMNGTILEQEMTSQPLWYEPDDNSLIDAMEQVRTRRVERERRARAGRTLMASRFTERRLNRIVRTILEELDARGNK